MTPVRANTTKGTSATVYELMPVTVSSSQRATVTKNVTMTIYVWAFFFISPSISSSTVFCEKGKMVFSSHHPTSSSTMTSGVMNIIHSPKPSPRFSPSGSFRYFKAMVFGGVPMGVPIPPRLAARGIDRAMAMRPLPSGGNCLNTGVRNVSIMAAVAVFDTNIEKSPVMRMNPSSTFSLLLPKGFSSTFASCASSPVFVAAMARMKPPMNSMMTGSANVAMTDLYDSNVPTSSGLHIHLMPLSDANSSISPMIATDVAHDDTTSIIHIIVAKAKMAIIRCCTVVSPSMPKADVGRFHSNSVTINTKTAWVVFLKAPLE